MFWGQRFGARSLGKPDDRWGFLSLSLSLSSTLTHPPTSIQLNAGGHRKLWETWPDMANHYEPSGAGRLPRLAGCEWNLLPEASAQQNQHSLLYETLPSFHLPLSSGVGQQGSQGKCKQGGQVTSCFGQKTSIMHKGVGGGHSMTDMSLPLIPFCGRKVCTNSQFVIMNDFLFPPLCL